MRGTRTIATTLFALCATASIGADSAFGDNAGREGGEVMGTTYSIKYHGYVGEYPGASVDDPAKPIRRVNDLMSTYDPNSELSRFNVSESDDWFPVSRETAETVQEAIEIGELTGGAFDVTVGPLVRLWNFGPDPETDKQSPSNDAIADAKSRTGLEHLEVRLDPPALRKKIPTLDVDLSGIAKGAGVDAAAEYMERQAVVNYMVEVGGEVRALGKNNEGRVWRIGLEVPLDGVRSYDRVLELDGLAVATSGDYRNYFEQGGKRYSHIIDPRTGRPIDHRLASVSILAETCSRADSLATALMVMGPDEGLQFAEEHGIAARLLVRTDDGRFEERTTDAFEELASDDSAADASTGDWSYVAALIAAFVVISFAFLTLVIMQARGRSLAKCQCGASASVVKAAEAREKIKDRREGRGDPGELPIIPPSNK